MEDTLFFYNPWWTRKIPDYLFKEYKRETYHRIKKYLDLNRIIILKGPRRVGKTTLLYQLVNELLKENKAEEILYVPFDDPKLTDFENIIEFYETKILKTELGDRKTYILLDEVQYLENWQYHLKKYYDRNYPTKFIATGSSATLIKKGSESLMGRTIEEVMLPFSFKEYAEYRLKKKITLKKGERNHVKLKEIEREAKTLLEDYMLKGGFPDIFETEEALVWQKMIRDDITDKVIYKDITTLYDIKKPETLEKLFLHLVGINGQILNINNISNSIGLSREYVNRYLTYLKNTYLILCVRKYTKSIEKTLRSNEKIYVIDPAIINSQLNRTRVDEASAGHLIESIIARHLTGREYYYFRNRHEVDFIVKNQGDALPIEVKYKNRINKKDLKGLTTFMEKFKANKGIVVTKDLHEARKVDGREIQFTPAWLFLLTEALSE